MLKDTASCETYEDWLTMLHQGLTQSIKPVHTTAAYATHEGQDIVFNNRQLRLLHTPGVKL